VLAGNKTLTFTDFFQAAFSLLIKELRQKFDKHGYLLSAAVAATKSSASLSYNIRDLGK
jgi:spore germination protein YaaH